MQCETVRAQLADRLTGALPREAVAEIERHLGECANCRAEVESLQAMWGTLGTIESPKPETARMRARLDVLLDAYDAGRGAELSSGLRDRLGTVQRPRWPIYAAQAAAALLLLALGVIVGRQTASVSPSPEIEAMREELQGLRHMVTLSLMQQQSASDRLKGVSWSGQIDAPGNEIVQALLDTLMHDPNVNVRLASIDALERFADRDVVRRTAIQAVEAQMSPLVQIALIDFIVKVNERNSVGVLRRLVDDPQVHEAVRARAAWGLQQIG